MLGGNTRTELRVKGLLDRPLLSRDGRQINVPALGGDDRLSGAGRYHAGDAKARAGADHAQWRADDRASVLDAPGVGGFEPVNAACQRGEVIDQESVREAKIAHQTSCVELPSTVG